MKHTIERLNAATNPAGQPWLLCVSDCGRARHAMPLTEAEAADPAQIALRLGIASQQIDRMLARAAVTSVKDS